MRLSKKLLISAMLVLCILGISACSKESNNSNDETINYNSDFIYPEKSNFSFEVSKDKINVKKGESITVDCVLKNISDENYYIEHGIETITYSYNDIGEEMDAVAILDEFKSNSEISRKLSISATESGKLTVSANIYIKPSQYSDQFKQYYFEKVVLVNVTV